MAIKGLFTDAGIGAAITAADDQGFTIDVDSFGVSNVAGVMSPSLTPNSGQWYTAPISSRTRIDDRTVKISCSVPQNAVSVNKSILEVYLYGKDPLTNQLYLLAVGQPDQAIQYQPSNTTTFELQISLVDIDLTAVMTFKNTFPVELAQHENDPNAHPEIVRAIHKAGILIPAGQYAFSYVGQNFDEYPEFAGTKSVTTYGGSTFTARRNGTESNGNTITFDGVKDLITVITAYNNAHPFSPVDYTGSDSAVLPAGTTPVFNGGTYLVLEKDIVFRDVDGIYKQAISDGTIKSKVAGVAYIADRLVKSSGFFSITTGFDVGSDIYLSSTNAGKLSSVSTAIKLGSQVGTEMVLLGVGGGGSGSSTAEGYDAVVSDEAGFAQYPTTQDAINAVGNGGRILVNKFEAVHTLITTGGKSLIIHFAHPDVTGWYKYPGTLQEMFVTFSAPPTSGTWRLELGNNEASESVDIPYNATLTQIQNAFLAMTGVPAGSTVTGNYTAGFLFSFSDNLNYPLLNFTNPGKNEIQKITIPQVPDDGTFQLRWNGHNSPNIAWNDTVQEVQDQIAAITGISSVSVTGSFASGQFLIEFTNQDGKKPQSLFTLVGSSLSLASSGTLITPTLSRVQLGQVPGNNTDKTITVAQVQGGTPIGPDTCIQIGAQNTVIEGFGRIQNFVNGIDFNNIYKVNVDANFVSTTHPYINQNSLIRDYAVKGSFGLSKPRTYIVGSPNKPGDFNSIVDALVACVDGDQLLVTEDQVLTSTLSITKKVKIDFQNGARLLANAVMNPCVSFETECTTRNAKLVINFVGTFPIGFRFKASNGHHENISVQFAVTAATVGQAFVMDSASFGHFVEGFINRGASTITQVYVNNSANISHNVRIRDADTKKVYGRAESDPINLQTTYRLLGGGRWGLTFSAGSLSWDADIRISVPGVPEANNFIPAGQVTLTDGDTMYVQLNPVIACNGSLVLGDSAIYGITQIESLATGMNVVGPGIQAGTTITTVGLTSVGLSLPATLSGLIALIASSAGALTPVIKPGNQIVPDVNTVIIAKRSGNVAHIGINSGEMALRPGEKKFLHGLGYTNVSRADFGEGLTSGDMVYISQGGLADGNRDTGKVYKFDASQTYQSVRAVDYYGFVINSGGQGSNGELVYSGLLQVIGVVAGKIYYADPLHPGKITATRPIGHGQRIVAVGKAIDNDLLMINVGQMEISNAQLYPVFADYSYGNTLEGIDTFTIPTNPMNGESIFVMRDSMLLPQTAWDFLAPNQFRLKEPVGEMGAEVSIKYVLADQDQLTMHSTMGIGLGDGYAYSLNFTPRDKASMIVMVGLEIIGSDKFTLVVSPTETHIVLTEIPLPGRDVYVIGFDAGLSKQGIGGIVAGSGITITPLPNNQFQIDAAGGSGGSGGGAFYIKGDEGTPFVIDPGVGIIPLANQRQLWFIASSGGRQEISSSKQIQDGTIVGQELTLIGTSDNDYISLQDGMGVKLNGDIDISADETIQLVWTGSVWREIGSRTI